MAVLTSLRSLPSRRVTAAATAFLVLLFALILFIFRDPAHPSYHTFPFSSVSDVACEGIDNTHNDNATATAKHVIPNLVHYVWLLKDPSEFRIPFKMFISVYSAHLFWSPDKIYIHTDAHPDVLRDAEVAGDIWTRRIMGLRGVTLKNVQAPTVTDKGVPIRKMEHKADFLRVAALREYGGVYLDSDAIPLRDIASLRNSGFANVLGGAVGLKMKYSGHINNGVMMSVPNSTLMEIFHSAAHQFFDGKWTTHSVELLTDLANRLLPLPSEVLVLQPQAFAPMSWEFADQKRLFKPSQDLVNHGSHGVTTSSFETSDLATCSDALAWLRERERGGTVDRHELDFSSSYVLHAFDDEKEKIRGWDGVIDLDYVLARRSVYARTVYPAVWHAVQAGVIPRGDVGVWTE